MRLLPRKAAPIFLIGTVLLCTVSASPLLADTPPSAAPRVQIQCTAVRARYQDVDDLGVNFSLMPSERVSVSSLAQTPPRFAAVTLGPDADRMLRHLTQHPGSVVKAFSLTTTDGQPGTFSLVGLNDPSVSAGSRLLVTPRRQANGAITLSIVPQLNFVILPGPGNPAAPVSVEAFPLRSTLPNGGFLAFTLYPKPAPGLRFGQVLPLIPAPGDPRHEDRDETQLWIFLSATVLPN